MTTIKALLLTDVVDSTRLSEHIGDEAMAAVWAAHDRTARDLLPAWRGREIDKTDGMLLLFDSAIDAAGYAQAYHHALRRLPVALEARAGLHLGPVSLRENSAADVARGAKPLEVEGLAKPIAARVMSAARGGQTLATAEAVRSLDAAALRLQSHGHWAMKGVAEPIELFEIGDPDARFVPPADGDKAHRVVRSGERWLPVAQIPNNLPRQMTSFVGREKELADLASRLPRAHLITLLGMGGMGKTRLALQLAAETLPLFADGAWFVDLSPLRDPALVVPEAAQALGVREQPDRPLIDTLCAALKPRRMLLIVDNCEHLIEAAGDLIDAVLRAAPQVRVVASSRTPLDLPGEQSYPILPLPLPRAGDSQAALRQSSAVRLFVERARAHRPDFEVGEADAGVAAPSAQWVELARLVARLEGIPLAIELAAARLRTLELDEIDAGLERRFALLEGGSRKLQPRQRTMHALVDWSYDLLDDDERLLLNRLGVFVGGFDAQAASAVCGAAPLDELRVAGGLASLAEKSLMTSAAADGAPRYRMLETIRDYALEKLGDQGEDRATAQRHCDYFFVQAKAIRDGINGAEQAAWIGRAEVDLDNLRQAIALALSGAVDAFIAVKFAVALMAFWALRGYSSEGRAVVRAALALPAVQASDLAHAHAAYVGAALAQSQSDHGQARQLLELCLALRRRLDHPVEIAATLSTLSLARLQGGDAQGAAACELEAREIFLALEDRQGEAIGLLHLGQIAVYQGDLPQAQSHLEGCLTLARALGQREVEGEADLLLGQCLFDADCTPQAQALLERSLAVCRGAADRRGEAHALHWLGRVALRAGNVDAAAAHLAQALQTFGDFEMREELIEALEAHAEMATRLGDIGLGARLAGAAQEQRNRLQLVRSPVRERQWDRFVDALRATLQEVEFSREWRVLQSGDLAAALRACAPALRSSRDGVPTTAPRAPAPPTPANPAPGSR